MVHNRLSTTPNHFSTTCQQATDCYNPVEGKANPVEGKTRFYLIWIYTKKVQFVTTAREKEGEKKRK